MTVTMTYYKVLNADRSCYHASKGKWEPEGVPMPKIVGDLEPCRNGYHVCTADQLINWVGPAIWEVDVDTDGMLAVSAITVVRGATLRRRTAWDLRSMVLWSLDCAEHVQHLAGPDTVALNAVTRRYIAGESSLTEVKAIRRICERNAHNDTNLDCFSDAADATRHANDAARCCVDAASYVNYPSYGIDSARYAANDAMFAARYAGYSEDSEKTWQANQLLTYL